MKPIDWKDFNTIYREITAVDTDDKVFQKVNKVNHRDHNAFIYIRNHDINAMHIILNYLASHDLHEHPEIWDIGAGTGRMVKIFKELGFTARGVEFHQPYVEIGRKLHGLSEEELICMDAFELLPKHLHNAKMIYTYMPMRNHREMTRLHFHLYAIAPFPVLFVEMYPMYYPMGMFNENARKIFNIDESKNGYFEPAAILKNYMEEF